MKRLILIALFIPALVFGQQTTQPGYWKKNADGSISPRGGESVAGVLSPIGCIFGDAATGSTLTTSETCYVRVPKACTIVGWSIMADAGTATVKTWRVATGGTAIPTVANSISTSGVSLSSGTAVYSTTVSDWTSTAIASNDWLAFNISAVATAKQITFQIDCQ